MAKEQSNVTDINRKQPGVVAFDPDLEKFIADTAAQVKDIKAKRKNVNQKMTELMGQVEAKGLNKKGFKRMVSLWEMDESDRKAMAFTIAACAKALNIQEPQLDMFAAGCDAETGEPVPHEKH